MDLSATHPRKNIATLKQFAGYFLKLGYEPYGDSLAAWRRDISDSEKVSAGRLLL